MTNYAYSPDTGELIRTETPADWMGIVAAAPPAFDAATHGCFWRGSAWELVDSRPRIAELAAEEIAAIAQAAADATAKAGIKADAVVKLLRDGTPAQAEAYVQANVTDLASTKALLKKVAAVLCVLSKQSLR